MLRNGASEITKEGEKLRSRKPYREVECYIPGNAPGEKVKPPVKTDICGQFIQSEGKGDGQHFA